MRLDNQTPVVFDHARAALRCWATHRRGPAMAGLGRGPAGHRAGIDDALAVGRVLVDLGLALDPPSEELMQLLGWAFGRVPRGELESLAKRVERHLRSAGVVAPPSRVMPAWRDRWVDAAGKTHETAVLLEVEKSDDPT